MPKCVNNNKCDLTYLLTPCSTVLLGKLTDFQLVKKFPAIYGTRRFITAFTKARQLSNKCDPTLLNGMNFQQDSRVPEYDGVHAISIVLTDLTTTL
jgi:hypothetical protein